MTKNNAQHVPVSELSGNLSGFLTRVEAGGEVIVTRHGVPVARIVRYEPSGPNGGDTVAREESAAYSPTVETVSTTALARLIAGSAVRAVMAVFLIDSSLKLHQREIARRSGLGLRSAQLALDKLERLGLLRSDRDGNRLYYSAVRTGGFEELQRLMSRELGIVEVIARHIADLPQPVVRAFIFGSVAAGTDTLSSDIDLLVVTDASADDLVGPIADAQRELGREIDLVHYRQDEFARRLRNHNHFVEAILAQPRIEIAGAQDDA